MDILNKKVNWKKNHSNYAHHYFYGSCPDDIKCSVT